MAIEITELEKVENSGLSVNGNDELLDDDGKPRRTGTVWTATAHIITTVIGAGVLSLAWSMAQLGWIIGVSSIFVIASVTLYTSNLLADCYRSPHPVTGRRNHTYMETVKTHLASITSFGYAFIGVGLSVATIIQGSETGRERSTFLFGGSKEQHIADKVWNMLVALGNIALASNYAVIAIDVQDSLKSSPPENKVMKTANRIGMLTMVIIFLSSACSGYAAFGFHTPGSILMSSGFKDPFWLVDLANAFIVVHLVGAYQIITQPIFGVVETWAKQRWPESKFVRKEYTINIGKMKFSLNLCRVVWRTMFVMVATILAMAMPFFNEMLAFLGATAFWPLVIYFPVEMFIAKERMKKRTIKWFGLQTMNVSFLILSMAIAFAAIRGLGEALLKYKPFMYKM
ncbi:unnamed protein product [Sphenostylis stenocarpa]|uniref:Amino acid transporter transmembrane domain-containing protein n=1 Tax=Sphenostylis stenocarpa TaxID=92480 RepID=A0AA86VL85_9FABA|nr:unnamed protein product [Sphenostylis stenocarpa]CAJ1972322.1 unnamed protein product [Sphenostylis stenocarpa]